MSPPGKTSPQGDKVPSWGQLRPWCQSLPLGAKLRMGLRCVIRESRVQISTQKRFFETPNENVFG
jgi:hypothetical protein